MRASIARQAARGSLGTNAKARIGTAFGDTRRDFIFRKGRAWQEADLIQPEAGF
jgi:hypothetical protein